MRSQNNVGSQHPKGAAFDFLAAQNRAFRLSHLVGIGGLDLIGAAHAGLIHILLADARQHRGACRVGLLHGQDQGRAQGDNHQENHDHQRQLPDQQADDISQSVIGAGIEGRSAHGVQLIPAYEETPRRFG